RHRVGTVVAALLTAAISLGLVGTSWGVLWALDEKEMNHQATIRAVRESVRARTAESTANDRANALNEVIDLQARDLHTMVPFEARQRVRERLAAIFQRALEHSGVDQGRTKASLGELAQSSVEDTITYEVLIALRSQTSEHALRAARERFAGEPLVKA